MAYADKEKDRRCQVERQDTVLAQTRAAKAAAKRPMPCPYEAMAAQADPDDEEARWARQGVM